MRRVVLVAFLLVPSLPAQAPLEPEGGLDPDRLRAIHDRYVDAAFEDVAEELATRAGRNPVLEGVIDRSLFEEPWRHSLALVLAMAWRHHTERTAGEDDRAGHLDVLMRVLENDAVGPGRALALREVRSRLDRGRDRPLPGTGAIVSRLAAIATDETESSPLRRSVLAVLFGHGDPNEFLELAIDLTDRESTALGRSEAFRFATPIDRVDRYTAANRARYLRHAFDLLAELDDGESGAGYFLAMHAGAFAGVEPLVPGASPFQPDQKAPEYQGEHGLRESFFQATVDNAMAWWRANEHRYEAGGD